MVKTFNNVVVVLTVLSLALTIGNVVAEGEEDPLVVKGFAKAILRTCSG